MPDFNKSYLDQASEFFATTDIEIDPDAALFYCFHQDSAFWLWMVDHLQSLVKQAAIGGVGNDAGPRIDRFLHGIITCDQLLGRQGAVIRAMVEILSHSPSSGVNVLSTPEFDLLKNLRDTGPYSGFTSTRFVHYAQSVLSPLDFAGFVRAFAMAHEHADIVLSASIANANDLAGISEASPETKSRAVYLAILNAVNQASLITETKVTAASVFSPEVFRALSAGDGLDGSEWQLLPLLSGGEGHAVSMGIDLQQAALGAPLGRQENKVWHLMLNTYHAAHSEALQSFLERTVLPHVDPAEVIGAIASKGPFGIAPAIEPWIKRYIEAHKVEFHAADVPTKMLKAFLKLGIDKLLIIKHPQFDNQLKGELLGDQLGL